MIGRQWDLLQPCVFPSLKWSTLLEVMRIKDTLQCCVHRSQISAQVQGSPWLLQVVLSITSALAASPVCPGSPVWSRSGRASSIERYCTYSPAPSRASAAVHGRSVPKRRGRIGHRHLLIPQLVQSVTAVSGHNTL